MGDIVLETCCYPIKREKATRIVKPKTHDKIPAKLGVRYRHGYPNPSWWRQTTNGVCVGWTGGVGKGPRKAQRLEQPRHCLRAVPRSERFPSREHTLQRSIQSGGAQAHSSLYNYHLDARRVTGSPCVGSILMRWIYSTSVQKWGEKKERWQRGEVGRRWPSEY